MMAERALALLAATGRTWIIETPAKGYAYFVVTNRYDSLPHTGWTWEDPQFTEEDPVFARAVEHLLERYNKWVEEVEAKASTVLTDLLQRSIDLKNELASPSPDEALGRAGADE